MGLRDRALRLQMEGKARHEEGMGISDISNLGGQEFPPGTQRGDGRVLSDFTDIT